MTYGLEVAHQVLHEGYTRREEGVAVAQEKEDDDQSMGITLDGPLAVTQLRRADRQVSDR